MTNELSFQIIALDKASATFGQVADQLERLAGRLDKLDGKDVNVDVNVKTDESTSALDFMDAKFNLISAGIVAGAPLIGGAIIGGIGAGFIGAAVLAQKSNADIQSTYKGLGENIVAGTKSWTAALVPQIVGAGREMNAEFASLSPVMESAFSAAGPDIVALTHGVDDFAHNAMPGVSSAMQQSLPVFQGAAAAASSLGQAVGDTAASVGQHSAAYGTDIASIGSITASTVGGATTVVNDLGEAWAQNSTQIDGAVQGTTSAIGGLADGVLPVLSFALGDAATAIEDVVHVLGPLAPILGASAAAVGLLWVGFKASGAVTSGVKAVGTTVADMGAQLQKNAEKSAVYVAGMEGVAVESSAAAASVKAAGIAASTSATGFGLAATAAAGWLGPALVAGTVLLGLFGHSEDDAAKSANDLKGGLDTVTSALESSNGVVNTAVVKALEGEDAFKAAADATEQFGISTSDLSEAVTKGGAPLDALKTKLQDIINTRKATDNMPHVAQDTGLNATVAAAQKALDALNALDAGFGGSQAAAAKASQALTDHAHALVTSSAGQDAAASVAKALGLSLSDVQYGFQNVAASATEANGSIEEITGSFDKNALAVAEAKDAISAHFKQADAAVVTSQQGVTDATQAYNKSLTSIGDAQHSYAQAALGVADAQYAVGTAERSVQDAMAGVVTARAAYSQAQKTELADEVALNKAREQAVLDLKALHLQLEDQVNSEESANVRLFDSTQAAAALGVTPGNAATIAGSTVTATNEPQVKAAIDLVAAQNAVNDTLNTGTNLRQQVADADKAGVNGSAGVISAQAALVSSQQAVTTAYSAIGKAQQQVTDADRNLVKAHQGVTDAAYNEARAHDAITDAQNASAKSAQALQKAKSDLKDAQDADTRGLDINTSAGRTNLTLLGQLWSAIQSTGTDTQRNYNTLVDDTSTAFGISNQAAITLLQTEDKIPKDFKYSTTAVAQVDTAGLDSVFGSGYFKGGFRSAGGQIGYATGGHIRGEGGPTDDKIPLWASDNEYIHPADAVDHYGVGFMEAVRQKKFPKFATGGLVSDNAFGAGTGAAYTSTVNALTQLGLPHPDPLPAYVPVVIGSFGGGPNGVVPSGQHLAMIDAALAADGVASSDWPRWEAGMNVLIGRESGWNAAIVNTWDSNAKKGTPSGGLTQTILPTFEAYRNPGLPDNMFDPVANIAASINYIGHRYGDISRVQQANPNMPPKGYDSGGWLSPGDVGTNRLGTPEAVLTPTESSAYVSHARSVASGDGGAAIVAAVDRLAAKVDKQQYLSAALYAEDGTFMGMVSGQVKQTVTGLGRQFGPLT